MKTKSNYPVSVFVILIALIGLTTWGSGDLATRDLSNQAKAVFAYDHEHPNVLPAHRVRALSIAISFGDLDGARRLLKTFDKVKI